jgi:tRNA1(Val) A37 N6-methylase TrmN6
LLLAPFAFAAVGCKNQDLTPTMADTHFKGWAKPGPIPPGASSSPDIPSDETLDAISGHFRLFQLRDGHRFSTDDVLTAWYGTTWAPRASSILDLGSGIGSVAMIAAWRLPGARVVSIEAQEESVRLARKSAAYNGLETRYEIREGDFREQGGSNHLRQGSGGQEHPPLREDERFDLILGSPPYFPLDAGIHGDHPQKVACRFELRGDIADYCGVAARHLDVGGIFACVFPEEQLPRIETATRTAELTIVRRRPVVFKEGEAPLIALFAMMRRQDLPEQMRDRTWVEPPLVIRAADGSVHAEYSAVKLSIGFPP